MCGLITMLSGYFSGPPILISPESTGGIKAGAKTGLSTCVCGLFFCICTFFAPVVKEVPNAATAPLLLTVGVILTQNVKLIDWTDIRSAFPAFACIFFIPFTYNILLGVIVGYVMFISIGLAVSS
jgi:AGZA family xanthine/uracil permease-like MFS transporter